MFNFLHLCGNSVVNSENEEFSHLFFFGKINKIFFKHRYVKTLKYRELVEKNEPYRSFKSL